MRRKTNSLSVEDSDRYDIFRAIASVCGDADINEEHFAKSIGWTYNQFNKVKRGGRDGMVLTKERRKELIDGIRHWNEERGHIHSQLLIDMGVVARAGQLTLWILAFLLLLIKFTI